MKILVFAHDATLYGASQSLITLLKGLKKHKVELLVLLPYSGPFENLLRDEQIGCTVVKFPRCIYNEKERGNFANQLEIRARFYFQQRSISSAIDKILQEFQPDVIYTNTSVISTGFVMAKKHNLPHVWHVREFGDLDYNLQYLPSIHWIKRSLRESTKAIFVSEAVKTHWMGRDNSSKLEVIYNGIVDEQSEATGQTTKEFPNRHFNIAILGAILPGKDQMLALRGFAQFSQHFSNATLQIFGGESDSDYANELMSFVANHDLETRVVFRGFVEKRDNLYRDIDVVLNSSVSEGFGRSIVESMKFGIPVIARNSGGIPELIEHMQTGLLFDGTANSLNNNLLALTNPQLYNSISEKAFKRAASLFSVKQYTDKVFEILKDSVSKK